RERHAHEPGEVDRTRGRRVRAAAEKRRCAPRQPDRRDGRKGVTDARTVCFDAMDGGRVMTVRDTPSHPLDHPIWTALTTAQQSLAEGDARARRYPTEITPFAAMPDMSDENFAALGALMSP